MFQCFHERVVIARYRAGFFVFFSKAYNMRSSNALERQSKLRCSKSLPQKEKTILHSLVGNNREF